MNNTAVVTVRIFSQKKAEYDIEVPLDITAYELFIALNQAFNLNYNINLVEECYLHTEAPIAFLIGKEKLLSEYGLRTGSIINVLPRNELDKNNNSYYLKGFDYSKVSFDSFINLSSEKLITIGNDRNCNLNESRDIKSKVKVSIINNDEKFYLQAVKETTIYINGKIVVFQDELIPLHNFDVINILFDCFYFYNKKLYMDKTSLLHINGVKREEVFEGIGAMTYPKFVRNSRLKLKIDDEPIKLLAPKEKPTKPKSNLLLKLMPVLGMIALTILLRGIMGNSNLSFVLFSVCSMSMGALVSVFTIVNDKKEYNQQIIQREIGYKKYIDDKQKEIEEARKKELQLLNRIFYGYNETSTFAQNFSGNLFDRIPSDDDFLFVRIGTGTIDAIKKIDFKPQEKYESDDDELVDLPVKLSEKYKKISNAPITIQLKEANVVGVVGNDDLLYEMMKIIYFDLCIRQHYSDVKTVLIIGNKNPKKYSWIKWFKHLNNPNNFRNIVCDNRSKNLIFEYLYAEFNYRCNQKNKESFPHIVIFVMDDFGIKEHPVSKYIEKASDYNATFIFFENSRDYIPLGCSQLILVDSEFKGRIIKNENTEIVDFMYVKVPDVDLYKISNRLAPVYCQEVSLESSLTKSITLYQLLGIKSESDINLSERWKSSNITKSMSAPIGVKSGNEIVYLDIHDNTETGHGPHGLVAGTTGSGKSEILMTYILSMATLYSPYEVAFLIIDFKGGGMGNQFKTLPHTLGVITDIDGKEIKRSLVSIKAEIERRKKLFADADVDHINKYIHAWKSKKIETPLPHLIIIVDEFAELKAQYGDFMAELNSTARVGRSLGVHLILATQKPQGQVDPQIDSNSKFRLCLKVQTPEDSREVIKTPLASEIHEAGRAYLMVGNNEIFELFQSAYSGASSKVDANLNQKEFSISAVDFTGRRTTIFERKHKKPTESEHFTTQKDAIINLINEYCKDKYVKLPEICQPPLEKHLEYVSHQKSDDIGIYVDLGIFDDPAQQRQELYTINIAIQNMLIIGALQTGKTNILQLLIRDLAEKYSPNEVNFYIIDYSSMILTNFKNLAHVGGVVVPNEDEKLNNLFKLLTNEISLRKQKLKSIGVSSYTAYKEAGKNDLPLIMLLIDNFASLKERNLNDNTVLLSILREGLSVGITVIVANGSTKGMEHRYLSEFACRIGLYHNNSEEYGNLFGTFKMTVESIPGRSIVFIDKKILECQIYQSFEGLKEINRVNNIKAFNQRINEMYPNSRATLIPEIPEFLMENEIRKQHSSCFLGYNVILGFDYDTLMPKTINLCGLNLLISGTPKSGKGNFIKYIISCLEFSKENTPSEIIIFDRATVKKFEITAKKYSCITMYEMSPENMVDICKKWKSELEDRKQLVLKNKGDTSVLNDKPLLMMIFEDSSKEMLERFDESLFSYLPYKFSWIASSMDNDDIPPMSAPKLYKAQKAGAGFMFFGNMSASKSIDKFAKIKPTDKTNRYGMEMESGDAFYVDAKDCTKLYRIKTIIHQETSI